MAPTTNTLDNTTSRRADNISAAACPLSSVPYEMPQRLKWKTWPAPPPSWNAGFCLVASSGVVGVAGGGFATMESGGELFPEDIANQLIGYFRFALQRSVLLPYYGPWFSRHMSRVRQLDSSESLVNFPNFFQKAIQFLWQRAGFHKPIIQMPIANLNQLDRSFSAKRFSSKLIELNINVPDHRPPWPSLDILRKQAVVMASQPPGMRIIEKLLQLHMIDRRELRIICLLNVKKGIRNCGRIRR